MYCVAYIAKRPSSITFRLTKNIRVNLTSPTGYQRCEGLAPQWRAGQRFGPYCTVGRHVPVVAFTFAFVYSCCLIRLASLNRTHRLYIIHSCLLSCPSHTLQLAYQHKRITLVVQSYRPDSQALPALRSPNCTWQLTCRTVLDILHADDRIASLLSSFAHHHIFLDILISTSLFDDCTGDG